MIAAITAFFSNLFGILVTHWATITGAWRIGKWISDLFTKKNTERMKLITVDQISEIAEKADSAIELKGFGEVVDGPLIKGGLTLGVNAVERWKDKEGNPMIPDSVCVVTQEAVGKILAGDYAEGVGMLEPIADKYVNFKKLDDDTEAALFGVVFFLLKTAVGYFQAK